MVAGGCIWYKGHKVRSACDTLLLGIMATTIRMAVVDRSDTRKDSSTKPWMTMLLVIRLIPFGNILVGLWTRWQR